WHCQGAAPVPALQLAGTDSPIPGRGSHHWPLSDRSQECRAGFGLPHTLHRDALNTPTSVETPPLAAHELEPRLGRERHGSTRARHAEQLEAVRAAGALLVVVLVEDIVHVQPQRQILGNV